MYDGSPTISTRYEFTAGFGCGDVLGAAEVAGGGAGVRVEAGDETHQSILEPPARLGLCRNTCLTGCVTPGSMW